MSPPNADEATITVAAVKNRSAKLIMAKLKRAHALGFRRLTVLNRGRPTLYLGLASDMPDAWASTDPATLPLSDLKRSQISLIGLRQEQQALILSQRGGATVALWPLEEGYESDAGARAVKGAGSEKAELAELRRRVRRLEQRLDILADAIVMTAEMKLRVLQRMPEDSKAKKVRT